jgi:hypothetical protein
VLTGRAILPVAAALDGVGVVEIQASTKPTVVEADINERARAIAIEERAMITKPIEQGFS